jgi:hypothetical protein
VQPLFDHHKPSCDHHAVPGSGEACEQAGVTVYLPKPITSGVNAKELFGKQDARICQILVFARARPLRRRLLVPHRRWAIAL